MNAAPTIYCTFGFRAPTMRSDTSGRRKGRFTMSRVVRLALVQCHSDLGTESFDPRESNLERALNHIKDAAAAGVNLVVFGELYLTGYRTDEWLHRWATRVDPPDVHVEALIDASRRYGVHTIMGMAT